MSAAAPELKVEKDKPKQGDAISLTYVLAHPDRFIFTHKYPYSFVIDQKTNTLHDTNNDYDFERTPLTLEFLSDLSSTNMPSGGWNALAMELLEKFIAQVKRKAQTQENPNYIEEQIVKFVGTMSYADLEKRTHSNYFLKKVIIREFLTLIYPLKQDDNKQIYATCLFSEKNIPIFMRDYAKQLLEWYYPFSDKYKHLTHLRDIFLYGLDLSEALKLSPYETYSWTDTNGMWAEADSGLLQDPTLLELSKPVLVGCHSDKVEHEVKNYEKLRSELVKKLKPENYTDKNPYPIPRLVPYKNLDKLVDWMTYLQKMAWVVRNDIFIQHASLINSVLGTSDIEKLPEFPIIPSHSMKGQIQSRLLPGEQCHCHLDIFSMMRNKKEIAWSTNDLSYIRDFYVLPPKEFLRAQQQFVMEFRKVCAPIFEKLEKLIKLSEKSESRLDTKKNSELQNSKSDPKSDPNSTAAAGTSAGRPAIAKTTTESPKAEAPKSISDTTAASTNVVAPVNVKPILFTGPKPVLNTVPLNASAASPTIHLQRLPASVPRPAGNCYFF